MIQELWLGDCLALMPNIPDASIDFICTDPPYGIGFESHEWDSTIPNWTILFEHFHRILKPTGNLIIFQGWSNVCQCITQANNFTLTNWIVWDRIKGRGGTRNFTSTREDILWFTKSKDYTFNKIFSNIPKKTKGMGLKNGQPNRSLSNVWYDISPIVPWSSERVAHPTQKPLQLMERLVTVFSNPGDVVFDPFAGSGSTLVAAKNLGRQFIGIEKDPEYFKIAKERVDKVML